MKHFTNLTQIAKVYISKTVNLGDIVVDATAGNGNDSLFLANLVGDLGKVYSFDIQTNAIKNTQELLELNNLFSRVKLVNVGHENISNYVSKPIKAAMFNLGYLPRGDHNIITKPETTISAIQQCLDLLLPEGIISLCIYTGHKGGLKEAEDIYSYVKLLDHKIYNVISMNYLNKNNQPPSLLFIEKQKKDDTNENITN